MTSNTATRADPIALPPSPIYLSANASAAAVFIGAMMCIAALTVDYFALGQAGFGMGQLLALIAGPILIGAGASIEVIAGRRSLAETLKFALIAVLVGGVLWAIKAYQIENRAFYEFVTVLMMFGFIANHYLPSKLRTPFVVLLSLGGFLGVFGALSLEPALWLLGMGAVLFVIAQAPIPLIARIAILSAIGLALALVRVNVFEVEGLNIVLPILASIFIFRLPIFLYDLHNKKGPKGLWQRIAYFCMMPNAVFPFFPVIDFSTFGRTTYNEDALRIYRRGAVWMLRGLIHLILYRVVNLYFVIPPDSVTNPAEFLQFIVSNFALYLRISGSFHLIIGLMMLFGFNLPETHTRFYFSTSFIDFWRRINIYWKDFMQKMIFNPSYMRLKRTGLSHNASVVIGMFAVFFGTWALHAYYWFWLRGTFLFVPQDIAFWALLALFLVTQTLLEARGHAPNASYLLGPQVSLVIRTVSTFLTICLLWSLWTTENVVHWLHLWSDSGLAPAFSGEETSLAGWAATLLTIAGVGVMLCLTMGITFGIVAPVRATSARVIRKKESNTALFRVVGAAAASLLVLLGIQERWISAIGGAEGVRFVASISEPRLNARDRAELERGYYEGLTNVNSFNSALWQILMVRPNAFSEMTGMAGVRERDDFMSYEYMPGSVSQFNDMEYRINRWGMRDKDYALEKPAGTYRVALVGASRGAGWGVSYEDAFATRAENMLNAASMGRHFEILNFSVDGYQPVERLMTLEEKVMQFRPDATIYLGGARDPIMNRMAELLADGLEPPYDFQKRIVEKAGVRLGMSRPEIQERIDPFVWEMLDGAYRRFVTVSREHGAIPIFVYLPAPWDDTEQMQRMMQTARVAGFQVIDLTRVFGSKTPNDYALSEWDGHPNAAGHKIIADALLPTLEALPERQRAVQR